MLIARIMPHCLLIPITALFFTCADYSQATMTSASYKVTSTVMAGGGGSMASANYVTSATLGQPSALGNASSTSFSVDPGFWYTILLEITVGDVNGDGAVNLEDVISALQVVTGQTAVPIFIEADGNDDGQIGLAEAIMLLRHEAGL